MRGRSRRPVVGKAATPNRGVSKGIEGPFDGSVLASVRGGEHSELKWPITASSPAGTQPFITLPATVADTIVQPNLFAVRCAESPPSWTNTKSMSFDGVDDFFSTADGGGLPTGSVANPCSFSFWIRNNSDAQGYVIPVSSNGATGGYPGYSSRFYLLTVPHQAVTPPLGGNRFYGGIEGDSSGNFSSSNMGYLTDDTWVHIVVTDLGFLQASPAAVTIYVDGVNVQEWEGEDYTTSRTQRFSIGGALNLYGTVNSLDCNIDEVGVWRSHVLSQTEVENIFNGTPGTSGSGSPTDLENTAGVTAPDSYYRMGDLDDTDGSGGVVKDRIGSYDMTAGGGNGSGAPTSDADVP